MEKITDELMGTCSAIIGQLTINQCTKSAHIRSKPHMEVAHERKLLKHYDIVGYLVGPSHTHIKSF